jgi:acyl dehydratase
MMTQKLANLSADQIAVGDKLPTLTVPVTPTTIVMGASASRDYQPQHHDHEWCIRVGLPGIVMNTPNQAGWMSRYITEWAGPMARLGRMKFRMRSSICPGDLLQISGEVMRITLDRTGCSWVDVNVEAKVGDRLATATTVTVALPSEQGGENPWKRKADRWLLAELAPLEDEARK